MQFSTFIYLRLRICAAPLVFEVIVLFYVLSYVFVLTFEVNPLSVQLRFYLNSELDTLVPW